VLVLESLQAITTGCQDPSLSVVSDPDSKCCGRTLNPIRSRERLSREEGRIAAEATMSIDNVDRQGR
jgi:hypothetical protein